MIPTFIEVRNANSIMTQVNHYNNHCFLSWLFRNPTLHFQSKRDVYDRGTEILLVLRAWPELSR